MPFGFFPLLFFYASSKQLCSPLQQVQYARNVKTKRKLIHALFPCNDTVFFQLEVKAKNTSSIIAKAILYTEKILLAEFEDIGLEWSAPNEN